MTHPDDRLADYVDGTLAAAQRAEVDAHLATCARCRDEVEIAGAARAALATLRAPVAVPPEVGATAIRASSGVPAAPGPPRWSRWIGAAAAAAVVVLAVAVAVPTLTGGRDAEQRAAVDAAAEDGSAPVPPAAPTLERIPGNLTEEDLPSLTEPARNATPPATATGLPAAGESSIQPDAERGESGRLSARAAEVADCLRTAFPDVGSDPLRLLELRFAGTPAYAGVYFRPASDDGAYDGFRVVVASRADCTILSLGFVRA